MCAPLGLGSEAEEGTYQVHMSTNIVLTEDVLSTAMPRAMPRVQIHTKYMLVQLQYILSTY
jgi:hypothetical protein